MRLTDSRVALHSVIVRIVAAALFVLLLGQALGLPAFEGQCTLAQCAGDERGTCTTACEACLCCAPVRPLPTVTASLEVIALVTSPVAIDLVETPPDSPPHEILHVPKA
jgi:hypothetical protein